jgi:hypothetical protein
MEEHIISTSLKGIKGPSSKQVIALFKAMALIPEDQTCPVEMMPLIYQAEADGAAATRGQKQPSLLRVRKFLKALIDRSLVLGTVDKPSLHDIVREFVIAQHSEDEIRDAHRRLVNSLRACRPTDFHGRKAWNNSKHQQESDPRSAYVCASISHHVTAGWESDKDSLGAESSCLLDTPQDELTVAAARMMGVEPLTTLASQSEVKEDWWAAAKLRSLCLIAMSVHATDASHEPHKQTLAACKLAEPRTESEAVDLGDMELACWAAIAMAFDFAHVFANLEEAMRAASSDAGKRNPAAAATISLTQGFPLGMAGDLKGMMEANWKIYTDTLHASQTNPDPVVAAEGITYVLTMLSCFAEAGTIASPIAISSLFPRDMILKWVQSYDYSFHHPYAVVAGNGDFMMWNPDGLWSTLVLHHGDFESGERYFKEHSVRYIEQTMNAPDWDAAGKEDSVRDA